MDVLFVAGGGSGTQLATETLRGTTFNEDETKDSLSNGFCR